MSTYTGILSVGWSFDLLKKVNTRGPSVSVAVPFLPLKYPVFYMTGDVEYRRAGGGSSLYRKNVNESNIKQGNSFDTCVTVDY